MPIEQIRFAIEDALSAAAGASKPTGVGRVYDAVLFSAGLNNGWGISVDVLAASLPLWEGASVFVDHPGFFSNPSVRDLVGVGRWPRFEESRIMAELHMLDVQQAQPTVELLDTLLAMRKGGDSAPRIGLSALLSIDWDMQGKQRVVTAITKVWSVDVVFEPAVADANVTRILNSLRSESMSNSNVTDAEVSAVATETEVVATPPPDGALASALLQAQCRQLLDMRLSTERFPEAVTAVIRAKFGGRTFHPDELEAEIASAKTIAAAYANAGQAIQGNGQPAYPPSLPRPTVVGMWSDLDRLQAAYDRLMGLSIPNELADTPRLTGIRELYHLVTGDRAMRGVFDPQLVMFANATTTTLAELTRNVINKVVVANWAAMTDYRWWERVVAMRDFETLKQVSWVTVGGFGDLATVTEGASYPEVAWDDSRETSNWLKKGGYLGLTLEMIDQDDTEKWRVVPQGMAIAALRTLSASVGNIFTQAAGAGPTLGDGTALFAAGHNNLRTTALSAAEWDQNVQAIHKQTELNSARRVGIRPTLLIVPIELRKTGVQIFVSSQEPGGANNEVNVAGLDQRFLDDNVIVCPEFTDATDFACMVDPRVNPALGVGFRFGRTPEIFMAGDPTSYLMFHNDTLPIKVRFFYNVGVIDYRPVSKNNVAG